MENGDWNGEWRKKDGKLPTVQKLKSNRFQIPKSRLENGELRMNKSSILYPARHPVVERV
jgi:hypothetical protein